MADLSLSLLWQALESVPNQNTRRKHVIALRSILKEEHWIKNLRIPRSSARVYDLPDTGTLRLALLLSPYELQGLLMMYGGLRVAEACAVTPKDLNGNVLRVHKQMAPPAESSPQRP